MQSLTLSVAVFAAFGIGSLHGCRNSPQVYPYQPPAPTAHYQPTAEQQIARGGVVYGQQCAGCHGRSGEGADAPALVGPGALPLMPAANSSRQTEFRTALDVAVFVTQNMPPDEARRRAIPEQDYWSLLAFALSANGVQLTQPVGPANAQQIVLHP